MAQPSLLEKAITAHGGRQRWQSLNVIEAAFSSSGLAFTAHMQPFALRNLHIAVSPHAQHVVLHDFCHPGWRGIWTPNHVELRDENNRLIAEREEPRKQFSHIIKTIRWDKLDILYFGGYALWNYLSFPFILESPGIQLTELGNAIEATFPEDFPTHSRLQSFHISDAGLLTRHDYTADVIGGWATAANYCLSNTQADGLRLYTRRRVYPRFGNFELSFPTLVWIEIDEIRLS